MLVQEYLSDGGISKLIRTSNSQTCVLNITRNLKGLEVLFYSTHPLCQWLSSCFYSIFADNRRWPYRWRNYDRLYGSSIASMSLDQCNQSKVVNLFWWYPFRLEMFLFNRDTTSFICFNFTTKQYYQSS